ncbi:MAG: electron transfer flavoprotein subunit beta, partial [Planctomycetota bacterium]
GIMKAKKKPYDVVSATGLAPQEVWGPGARVSVKEISLLPTRKVGRKLQGGAVELVEDLVKFLREEVRII